MRPLKPHQRHARRFVLDHGRRSALIMDPGTGKTIVAIRTAVSPVLVLCRRDDFMTWKLELEREGHAPPAIIDSGDVFLPPLPVAWTLCTYDLVKNQRIFDYLRRTKFQTFVFDESQSIKHWSSDRTKRVYRATRHIPYRFILTGTLITNEPSDVYSQILMLDDGALFGNNEWSFMKQYYIKDGKGWYLKKTAKESIAAKLKSIAFSVRADDVLDLPPQSSVVKAVPLGTEQTKAYEKLLTEWEYAIESTGQTYELDQVIVQLNKLRQVSSGFLYYHDEDFCRAEGCGWKGPPSWMPSNQYLCPQCQSATITAGPTITHWYPHPSKLSLLHSLLNEIDRSKVVIWCAHTAEIDRINNELPGSVRFAGDLSTRQREQARARFRDDPNTKYFVGQVDAGVGMNELVAADTAIYYSNSFKVSSRLQSRARTRRIGSEIHKTITYYDLVCEKTIDVRIIRGLSSAIGLAEQIAAAIRKRKPIRDLVT